MEKEDDPTQHAPALRQSPLPTKVKEGAFTRLSAMSTLGAFAIAFLALLMSWDWNKVASLAFWRSPQIIVTLDETLLLEESIGLPSVTPTVTYSQSIGPPAEIHRARLRFGNRDTQESFDLEASALLISVSDSSRVVPWRAQSVEGLGRTHSISVQFTRRISPAERKSRRELSDKLAKDREKFGALTYRVPAYFETVPVVPSTSGASTAKASVSAPPKTEEAVELLDASLVAEITATRQRAMVLKRGNHDLCLFLFGKDDEIIGKAAYRFFLDDLEVRNLEDKFKREYLSPRGGEASFRFFGVASAVPLRYSTYQRSASVTLEVAKDAACLEGNGK